MEASFAAGARVWVTTFAHGFSDLLRKLLFNFVKNKFFGTRKYFQNPELNDVLPTDGFQNPQIRKGVLHRYDHFWSVLGVNVG